MPRGRPKKKKWQGFAANPALARIAGKKGGDTVKRERGSLFFSLIGEKGGAATQRKYGEKAHAHYVELGRRGGIAKAAKYAKAEK